MIQLFDIKTRTLGFSFCQPQKSPYQNLSPQKSPQIANFKPKKGLRTSPSLIYLSTPPGSTVLPISYQHVLENSRLCLATSCITSSKSLLVMLSSASSSELLCTFLSPSSSLDCVSVSVVSLQNSG